MPESQAISDAQPALDTLWDYDDPMASEGRFRARLGMAETNASDALETRTQLARSLGLQARFDEAHHQLDAVDATLKATPHHARARIRYVLERGRLYNSSGDKAQAKPLFVAAWELASRGGEDFLAVDAAHMVAIAEDHAGALAWNHKAMALAEASSDPLARKWLGSLYNNMGWSYHDAKDYDQAMALFVKAVDWHRERRNEGALATARWCVARCLRSQGKLAASLAEQRLLLAESQASGKEGDGFISEEIAECLYALGQADAARPYFRQAHAVLLKDTWLAKNESARLERLARLGDDTLGTR